MESSRALEIVVKDKKMPINHKKILGFGKQIEYKIMGLLVKECFEVYSPLIDDDAIDFIIKKPNGTFIEIQIKARSKAVAAGSGGRFALIDHKKRKNYFFIFYCEKLDTFWIMSSEEFIKHSKQNKAGKYIGRRNINLTGKRADKKTGECKEYVYERFKKYIAKDFSRFK